MGVRGPTPYIGLGAGRPAAGRPASGTCLQFFSSFFAFKSLPPGSGAAMVYFCKFSNRKCIFFVKNGNKKIKKPPYPLPLASSLVAFSGHLLSGKRRAPTQSLNNSQPARAFAGAMELKHFSAA